MISLPHSKIQFFFKAANDLYLQKPDWVTFYDRLYGVNGLIHEVFEDYSEQEAFEQTPEYLEIENMTSYLRRRERRRESRSESREKRQSDQQAA